MKFPANLEDSPPHHLGDPSRDVEEEPPARCTRATSCTVNPGTPCRRHRPAGLWRGPSNRTAKFLRFALEYYRKLFVWLMKIKHTSWQKKRGGSLKILCCHGDTWFPLSLTFLKPWVNQGIFLMEMFVLRCTMHLPQTLSSSLFSLVSQNQLDKPVCYTQTLFS